jgi:hypothetical protein
MRDGNDPTDPATPFRCIVESCTCKDFKAMSEWENRLSDPTAQAVADGIYQASVAASALRRRLESLDPGAVVVCDDPEHDHLADEPCE